MLWDTDNNNVCHRNDIHGGNDDDVDSGIYMTEFSWKILSLLYISS